MVFHILLRDISDFSILIILEKGGKQLYSTKDAVRNKASRKEYFQIILPS